MRREHVVPSATSEGMPRTTGDLTDAERWLVQIMSNYQFGRVENLAIRAGQPIIGQDVKVVRVAQLGGDSGGTKIPVADEFELKRSVRDLFEELSRLGNGLIVRLEFKRGLPCRLETTARVAPVELPNDLCSGQDRLRMNGWPARGIRDVVLLCC
jgi:hypothetical protein